MSKFAIVIPARQGSKGIKNKNIKKVKNLHLIEFILKEIKTINFSKYIVTDSNFIKKIANKYKINTNYIRPATTSGSKISLSETLYPFCKWLRSVDKNIENLVILQCTSPLTKKIDIDKAVNIFNKKKYSSLFSVSESIEHPYETINIKDGKWNYNFKEILKFKGRQEYKINSYFINGSIYITKIKNIINNNNIISKNHGYSIMPKSRSLDINDIDDLNKFKKIITK